jgi:hypothetical protein
MTKHKEEENLWTIVVAVRKVRINWIWEQFKALKCE